MKGKLLYAATCLAAFAPSGVALDPARKPILAEGFSLDAKGVNLGPWGYVVIEYF